MSTTLMQPQRISVTIPSDISPILTKRAQRENISLSKAVVAFVMDAIENDEKAIYDEALERKRTATTYVSHAEAWK